MTDTLPPLDLHAAIMNLPLGGSAATFKGGPCELAYSWGHRDARHAAAELVSAALPAAQPTKRDHFCNKCGNVVGTQKHNRPDGKECHYLAVFVGAAPVAAQPTSGVALPRQPTDNDRG
jgi:hypothetical protein